jgi:2-polyprenyl-3-methyl-5-hydroxy-6-metoxy-1,4-benzoquinol methylase
MGSSTPSCRLCDCDRLTHRFTVRNQRLFRCENCGMVQVADRPSAEELDAIYGKSYFGSSKYADQATLLAEANRRLALLQAHVPAGPDVKVLDAGCATGDFIAHAQGHYRMSGIDVSPAAVESARQRLPDLAGRLWTAGLDRDDLGDEEYDAICLWDVIEHLWDPVKAATMLFRHLKPGGCLLLSTPAADALLARLMGRYWAFMTPPEHLSFFSRRSIHQLFEQRLNGEVLSCQRRGKRANVGFIVYKVKRLMPLVPQALVDFFRRPLLARWSLYVPTGDVQYAVVRKRPSA